MVKITTTPSSKFVGWDVVAEDMEDGIRASFRVLELQIPNGHDPYDEISRIANDKIKTIKKGA